MRRHYLLLRATYETLTRRGADVTIPEQGGDGSLPDARIRPPEDADPVVEALTDGDVAPIEAEKSTGDSKPGQTVLNLASAVNADRHCVFVAKPDDASRVWSTLVSDPELASGHDAESGETRLFNATRKVRVGGELAYREGSRESRWFRDEETGEIVLRDDAGDDHAQFESAEAVFADAGAYAAVGRDGERAGDLRTVRAPVIPEHEFDGEPPAPDRDEWTLLVVDTDGETDDLRVYRGPDRDAVGLEEWAGDDSEATDAAPAPEELDVTDRAIDLLRLLLAADAEAFTKSEAHTLATEQGGDDLDVSRRTITNWIDDLADEGALRSGEYRANEGQEYRPVRNG